MKKIITKSAGRTKEVGEKLARIILKNKPKKQAVVVGLEGNLGGGKTTFLQGFAKGLGIKEKILSPTFVILKRFKIPGQRTKDKKQKAKFGTFYHADCYRIKNPKELSELGFDEIISNSGNVVAVEWAGRIKKILPKGTIGLNFKFVDKKTRKISLESREPVLKNKDLAIDKIFPH